MVMRVGKHSVFLLHHFDQKISSHILSIWSIFPVPVYVVMLGIRGEEREAIPVFTGLLLFSY